MFCFVKTHCISISQVLLVLLVHRDHEDVLELQVKVVLAGAHLLNKTLERICTAKC